MKKMFRTAMIAFAALALGLTSCNNDDAANDGLNGVDGQKASLTVRLANPSTTKAATASHADDMNVGEYLVAVFDKNGVIITSAVQNSADAIQNLETTTAANQVMVIANYNSALTITTTEGTVINPTLTTRDKLIAALENGTNNNLAKSDGTAAIAGGAECVWLAGESAKFTWSDANITQSGTYFQAVSIAIRAVVAKIDLTVEVPDAYNPATGANPGNFRMTGANDGIVVLNAVSTTKFFGDKPFNGYDAADYPWLVPATKAYYSGISAATYPNLPATTTTMNFLMDAFTGNGATTLHYHYYLFENDANTTGDYPTIITLKGTWGSVLTPGNTSDFASGAFSNADEIQYANLLAPRPVYFPIQLISADAGLYLAAQETYGKGVQRGKKYNITLRLTDKVFEGEYAFPKLPIDATTILTSAPGVADPSEIVAEAYISVTVNVEDWTPMNITKEW